MAQFQWPEFLEVARFLCKEGRHQGSFNFSEEAAIRCAVSRAYYSAFCHAREYVERKKWYNPEEHHGCDHGNVPAALKKHNKITSATTLLMLLEWRRQSDYELNIPNIDYQSMSSEVLDKASSIHLDLI
jgi:uncharacterized protein (UPF0332 family)